MENLRVSIVQSDLIWENPEVNRKFFDLKISAISETDVIVLPEMFTTGFTMNAPKNAEETTDKTLTWMQKWAKIKNAAVTGSFIIEENGLFFNRLFWVFPDGTFTSYNKHHLFTLAGESKVYTAGNEKVIVAFRGWNIRLFICYDLRFPVWCRNCNDYDLAIFVASWPEKRIYAWTTLLSARAIENMAYVVGVNRVGTDETGLNYSGDSGIYHPLGYLLTNLENYKEGTATVGISFDELTKLRKSLNFLADADEFGLKC